MHSHSLTFMATSASRDIFLDSPSDILALLSEKLTRINSAFQQIHFTVLYFTRRCRTCTFDTASYNNLIYEVCLNLQIAIFSVPKQYSLKYKSRITANTMQRPGANRSVVCQLDIPHACVCTFHVPRRPTILDFIMKS